MKITLPYDMFTLDNGLQVVVHQDRRTPIACVDLWYRVGSKDEAPGRTGFAHLFEHLMFEGSTNVPEGAFDELLEEVGGINNGSTSTDRTNYWELVPSHALDLALWLEADRMGGLLPAITPAQLEAQRGVVMNERRQSYENRPYGLASETLLAALYPPEHPYSWPIIGHMADIAAATIEDVHRFGSMYYTPNNATLVVAGDVEVDSVRDTVERCFGDIQRGPDLDGGRAASNASATLQDARGAKGAMSASHSASSAAAGGDSRRVVLEDNVSLPRLYMAWHSPAAFAPGDAALDTAAGILAHGRASRLHRSLVYERQVAQSVAAYQSSALLGSTFRVTVTARPGVSLRLLEDAVRAEIEAISHNGIADVELARARNAIETGFVDGLQSVGGFGGRADQLNLYLFHTGEPDFVAADLDRYERLTADEVSAAVHEHLTADDVVLDVVRHTDAAAGGHA
jgi:zinc protease